MAIKTEKTAADDKNKAKHRRLVLFKTVAGRVNFVVATTAVLVIAAVVYGASELFKEYGSGIGSTAAAVRIAIMTALLVLAAAVISKWTGGILITGRIKKLAQIADEVVRGETDAAALPYGLGELDGLTADFEKLASELRIARETMEKKVHLRTSVLELSKGMTELEKARTDALLASVGEGVVATDLEGKVSFLNGIARDALWWNPDAVMGVPIHSAFRLEDEGENVIDEDLWPVRKVLKEGGRVVTPAPTKPYYLRLKDKSRFPVKMTISPVVIQQDVVGALLTFSDIGNEVEFDRRKSEFISIASHQLRSPATAVKMMTDMMRDGSLGELTEKQKEWMNKLYMSSDLMLDLISELLNISRLEAGVETEREPRDIAEFAKDVMKQSEPLLLMKKQKFSFVRNGTASPAFDPLMIGEVMKNLISNASKYSPENGTITVSIDVTDAEARFSVTDRGIGIPKSEYNRMFNKFFRAENALKSQITGTGLGLYYCKTVIEKHGGKIGFDSEVGKGSTFWFDLPLKRKSSEER